MQHDPSDTNCSDAEVAIARVWLSPAPPHASCGDGDESSIAASYVVAYDQSFCCPIILFSFSHCTTGQPLSHARCLELVSHEATSISQRICCGVSMYMLHPCATSAFVAAMMGPSRLRAKKDNDLAAFIAWFSVYSTTVACPPSAAQRAANALAEGA